MSKSDEELLLEGTGRSAAVPVFAAAVVLGAAIGVGVAFMRKPRASQPITSQPASNGQAPHAGSDAQADASTSGDARASQPDAESWVDLLDAAQPPPESQGDTDFLVSLVTMAHRDDESIALARAVIGGRRHRANQGNWKIATHHVSKAQCLEGLRDVEIQTPLQRVVCEHPYEVPIHHGDPLAATTCIDVFEYPNLPCELPFVHLYGMQAEQLCALDGKRLCTDEEWDTACEADPNGGPAWQYAYGNTVDLSICDTGKPWPPPDGPVCKINDDLWNTCTTNTEPSGAFPKCRSRLGVYDQHGNVAEFMHRWENGVDYIQMKGSAFFYDGKMYRDHCRYDPRWHVDEFKHSWHDNYHLGFRCCRPIKSVKQRMAEDAGVSLAGTSGAGVSTLPKPSKDDHDEGPQDASVDPSKASPAPSASEDDPYGTQ